MISFNIILHYYLLTAYRNKRECVCPEQILFPSSDRSQLPSSNPNLPTNFYFWLNITIRKRVGWPGRNAAAPVLGSGLISHHFQDSVTLLRNLTIQIVLDHSLRRVSQQETLRPMGVISHHCTHQQSTLKNFRLICLTLNLQCDNAALLN